MTQKATRAAVQTAYDSLVARDIPPTYEAVRDQIGGGSMTTIARHLRQIAAGSSPSASLPPAPSAPPSDEAPVELPLELELPWKSGEPLALGYAAASKSHGLL